jgi:putative membrane protein
MCSDIFVIDIVVMARIESTLAERAQHRVVNHAQPQQWGADGHLARHWAKPASGKAGHRRRRAALLRGALESRYPLPMLKLIVRWLLLAAALLLVAYLYSGVTVASFGAAMIAAFVLGLFNTIVRPLLVLLTLPVTLITLGLFLFVINALMFWAAAGVLAGFNVTGFGAALIGSLIYSLCGMVIDVAVERLFAPEPVA